MYCMRERTDFTHLFGMWKLLPHLLRLYQNSRQGVQQINLNLIIFLLPGRIVKVISNINYKCPNFTAFCFFQKAKIIVQRHFTWRPYKNKMLFRYSARTASFLSLGSLRGPSWECGHYLVLKTKSKEESWIVVVPSFSGSFKTLMSHTIGD